MNASPRYTTASLSVAPPVERSHSFPLYGLRAANNTNYRENAVNNNSASDSKGRTDGEDEVLLIAIYRSMRSREKLAISLLAGDLSDEAGQPKQPQESTLSLVGQIFGMPPEAFARLRQAAAQSSHPHLDQSPLHRTSKL